jgi:hypothetical protein
MLERIKADIVADKEQKAILQAEIYKMEQEMLLSGDFKEEELYFKHKYSSVVFESDQHTIELNLIKGFEKAEFDF